MRHHYALLAIMQSGRGVEIDTIEKKKEIKIGGKLMSKRKAKR